MVIDLDANPVKFHWTLRDPFLPFKAYETSFYHRNPIPLEWKAKILPFERTLETMGIKFTLQCSREGEDDFEVPVERVEILIWLNDGQKDHIVDDYVFCKENDHTLMTDEMEIPAKQSCIEIEIKIYFLKRYLCDIMDLDQLSSDLERFLSVRPYSDCTLHSNENQNFFYLHLCIMRARWPSLFEKHRREAITGGHIRTDFQYSVLRDILNYMYTGKGRFQKICLSDEYDLDLYRAAEEYKLETMYGIMVNKESVCYMAKIIHSDVYAEECNFKLCRSNIGVPLQWEVCLSSNIKLHFVLTLLLYRAEPCFTYELRCWCTDPVHIRVQLEYWEKGEKIGTVHKCDYRTECDRTLKPGCKRFEGGYPKLAVFLDKCRKKQSLACVDGSLKLAVYVTNGARVTFNSTKGYQPDSARELKILSNEIYRSFFNSQKDLRLEIGDTYIPLDRVIFAARVPFWWRLVWSLDEDEVVGRPELIPTRLRYCFGERAFETVIKYIYSGKIFPFSNEYLDEVRYVGKWGGMTFLVQQAALASRPPLD